MTEQELKEQLDKEGSIHAELDREIQALRTKQKELEKRMEQQQRKCSALVTLLTEMHGWAWSEEGGLMPPRATIEVSTL